MHWIFWVALIWLAVTVSRRRACWGGGWYGPPGRGRWRARGTRRDGALVADWPERRGGGRRGPVTARRQALPPESPLDRLQRQFVQGRLTVEEYEREVDRVLRK